MTETRAAGLGSLLTRPALDEPHVRIRPDGRQLVIDRGSRPTSDDGEDDTSGTDTVTDETRTDTSTRERITGFSDASRRRLRKTVHSLRRDASCLFITLTYHEHTPTPEEAKRDLDVFFKRLRRRFSGLSGIWKMEPQQRGTPHYHILLYGVRWLDAQWLSQLWHDVTAETSEQHRVSGVDTEWVRDDGKLQVYLAKYMSKSTEEWPTEQMPDDLADAWRYPGRYWAVWHRTSLPVAEWADWAIYLDHTHAASIIADLLEAWQIDLGGIIPPSLTINTRGDPVKMLNDLVG